MTQISRAKLNEIIEASVREAIKKVGPIVKSAGKKTEGVRSSALTSSQQAIAAAAAATPPPRPPAPTAAQVREKAGPGSHGEVDNMIAAIKAQRELVAKKS